MVLPSPVRFTRARANGPYPSLEGAVGGGPKGLPQVQPGIGVPRVAAYATPFRLKEAPPATTEPVTTRTSTETGTPPGSGSETLRVRPGAIVMVVGTPVATAPPLPIGVKLTCAATRPGFSTTR